MKRNSEQAGLPSLAQTLFKAPDEIDSESLMAGIVNVYNFRSWWNAILAVPKDCFEIRAPLYNRALSYLPGSYKLWYNYLKESRAYAKQFSIIDQKDYYTVVNEVHELALGSYMAQMPKIWLDYLKFLQSQKLITQVRHVYNRALQNLPVAQHNLIWTQYLTWVIGLTKIDRKLAPIANHAFKRYIKLKPEKTLDYLEFLLENDQLEDALSLYVLLVNQSEVKLQKSTKGLYMELAEFIAKFPTRAQHIEAENILQVALEKYPEEASQLWVFSATYFTRMCLFDRAREVFEQSMDECDTVASFGILYSAYLKFEQTYAEETQQEEDFERLEQLLDRRPFLLSNVVLRQNPNNVNEWLNRIELCKNEIESTLATFTEALKTVDPQQAVGKISKIWVKFATFYESYDELENANFVYYKATQQAFKTVDELSTVYCLWAEMHIRHSNVDSALQIMKYAVSNKQGKITLANNIRSWHFYIDLLQSCEELEEAKWAYEHVLEIKIATPVSVLNYTSMLQQQKQFEESFRVFERAINAFPWPNSYEIWLTYLTTFIQVMGGQKIERVRHLFRECLKECPEQKKEIFLLIFADYEENFGLLSHAMDIYDKATREVPNQMQIWNIYISKAMQYHGVIRCRQIYQKALKALESTDLILIGLRFAKLERKLNEFDRARAIFTHLSQYCNPATYERSFWKIWENFEIQNGNRDNYEDFLRCKRSQELRYSVLNPVTIENTVIEQQIIEQE